MYSLASRSALAYWSRIAQYSPTSLALPRSSFLLPSALGAGTLPNSSAAFLRLLERAVGLGQEHVLAHAPALFFRIVAAMSSMNLEKFSIVPLELVGVLRAA